MIKLIVNWLIARHESKKDYILIGSNTPTTADVYLIRYGVIRTKWLTIYIHRFMRSDRDDLHDHPWHFFSYVVKGSYLEYRRQYLKEPFHDKYYIDVPTVRSAGSFAFRKARTAHRVVVSEVLDWDLRHRACTTICICGPRFREWGFIIGAAGWMHWKKYLGVS